jgi:hypothetical protein
VLSLAVLVAGCANDAPNLAGFATTSSLAIASPAVALTASQPAPPPAYRKTMSDRVLTAIALERVTGLKPDPARLAE